MYQLRRGEFHGGVAICVYISMQAHCGAPNNYL